MAGTLTVQNIEGPSSGANSNTILIPSGQTLHAPGHVIQAVQHTDNTDYTASTSSYVQGPQTGTINLTNSSSMVLVTINACVRAVRSSAVSGARVQIFRGSIASGTRLHSGTEPQFYANDAGTELYSIVTVQYLDTPGSSSVTYSIGFNKHPSSGDATIKGTFMTSTIVGQEIAQ